MFKKIFGIFFAALTVFMSVLIMFTAVTDYISRHSYKKSDEEIRTWDGSEAYPLPDDAKDKQIVKMQSSKPDVIKNLPTKIQNRLIGGFKYRMSSVLLKNYYQKTLGIDMTISFQTENDISDSFDIVTYFDEKSATLGNILDDVDISKRADKLIDFGKYVKGMGINFLYFHTPGKFASSDVYEDYSEIKNKDLMNSLSENNIDYINFNDYMPKDKHEYAKMFYKTDHHWLPSSGLYANEVLCDYLNSNYGYSIDTAVFGLENYKTETTEQPFLGSLGKKVTEVYAEPERFDIYYPDYHTDLEVYNSKYDEYKFGEIKDTLFDYSVLSDEMYTRNNYAVYGNGDIPYCSIHNNDIHDGSHILIIKTSFANCQYPYLSAVFEDIDVIDLRYFNGSIKSFINDKKPDTVIVSYGMSSYEGANFDKLFNFQ